MNETGILQKQDLKPFQSVLLQILEEQRQIKTALCEISDLLEWRFRDDPLDIDALDRLRLSE